jgi:mannosyltransferase
MSALTVRPRPQPDALGAVAPARRRPRWADLAVVAVAVALGAALRIRTREDLWVDEAISVSIARLRVADLLEALRHDGHPPVYYLLLHVWMDVFGEGATAVRMFSALISLATLPVAWVAGLRLGGRRCALAVVVLMAVTPSAVRFGSETRMYALVVLLALLGWLAARRAFERPSLGRLLAVTVVTGLLLLTHYWTFYLVAAALGVAAWAALWGPAPRQRAARRLFMAVATGTLFFLPWLPVFLDQLDSTGTPWGLPARPAQVLASLLVGGGQSGEAQIFGVFLAVLVLLGLLARPLDGSRVELNLRTRSATRVEVVLIAITLALGTAGGYVGDVAFVARYTAVVLPLLLLVCAFGVTQLPSWRWRDAILAVVVVVGLVASLEEVLEVRTQAPDVAAAIEARSTPGEVVAYCPSQLGPGVSRLLPDDRREVTFPDLDGASRVNWTDYLEHVRRGDPRAFAAALLERAGDGPLWVVWAGGHRGLGRKCEDVVQAVEAARPEPTVVLTPKGNRESSWLYRFPPPLPRP